MDSRDMNIEQLQEKNTGLEKQIKMLQALVPDTGPGPEIPSKPWSLKFKLLSSVPLKHYKGIIYSWFFFIKPHEHRGQQSSWKTIGYSSQSILLADFNG